MEITGSQFFIALMLSLIAGVGTVAGSVLAFFCPKDDPRTLSLGLGFSAGVMIYISFMELLPDAVKSFEKSFSGYGDLLAIACFFGGIAATLLIDKLIPADINPHEPKEDLDELKICPLPAHPSFAPAYHSGISVDQFVATYESGEKPSSSIILRRTGLFTAIAIAIHNFPEGFATFASALGDLNLGVAIAIAVAIHNIPEGLAVSLPIYRATGQKRQAFIFSALSGLAEPVGAVVGGLLLLPFLSAGVLAATFAGVAGVMVFISLDELLPSAKTYDKAHDSLYGLVGGMAVMAIGLHFL